MWKKLAWVFGDVVTTILVQFAAILVLSRILSPRDYGVVGAVSVFIAIGNMLIDSGMGGAIIQKKEVTSRDFSTLFLFNIAVSLSIYFVYFLLSDRIEAFYGIEDLSQIIRVLALTLIISSIGLVQMSRLFRELKYKQLAIISTVANLVGLAVACLLAVRGYGPWALVWQQVSAALVRNILYITANRFIPAWEFSVESFKYMYRFGVGIIAANIVNAIYSNFTSSLIPKISNVTDNGYYTQASKLEGVPSSIISAMSDKALFPIISDMKNKGQDISVINSILETIYLLAIPVIITLAALSYQIIYIVLGTKWLPAVDYLSILMFAAVGAMIQCVNRGILKSLGVTKPIMLLSLSNATVGILAILSGSVYGVKGILYGLLVSSVINSMVAVYMLSKHSSIGMSTHLRSIFRPLAYSLVAYILMKAILALGWSTSVWGVAVSVVGLSAYVAICFVCRDRTAIRLYNVLKNKAYAVFHK